MIISGKEIKRHLGINIIIDPFDEAQLNPNSYNLRLHNELFIYTHEILDAKKENAIERIVIPDEGLVLEPGRLYLGRSVEYTATDAYVPMLEGRSSYGRLGLYVHITSGFGNVGSRGFWTLEISCVQPVKIYPNLQICQIYFMTIQGEFDLYEEGKYKGAEDIQASMAWKDFAK